MIKIKKTLRKRKVSMQSTHSTEHLTFFIFLSSIQPMQQGNDDFTLIRMSAKSTESDLQHQSTEIRPIRRTK